MKIIKYAAIRCHIVKLKCTKFRLGLPPDLTGEVCNTHPNPLAELNGLRTMEDTTMF